MACPSKDAACVDSPQTCSILDEVGSAVGFSGGTGRGGTWRRTWGARQSLVMLALIARWMRFQLQDWRITSGRIDNETRDLQPTARHAIEPAQRSQGRRARVLWRSDRQH